MYFMRLAFRLFLLGLFLTSCATSPPTPVLTSTTYKPIIPTTTVLATLTVSPSSTITPIATSTAAYREIKVSSKWDGVNKYTYLEGFVDHVNSLAWSGDGKTLIIASQQNYLVYFDTQSSRAIIGPVRDWAISTIAISPNSKMLAVNSDSRFIESALVSFVDLETRQVSRIIDVEKPFIFDGKTNLVYGSTGIFAPDGKTFILNSGKQITLWDVASGNQIKVLYQCDPNFVVSGLFLNSAKNLLFTIYNTNGWDKENKFLRWDTNTWELTKTFTGDFMGFSFSPDGDTFTPIHKDINIVHSNNATELFNFTGSQNLGLYSGRLIAYDPSGKYVAIGNRGHIIIYDAHTGNVIRPLYGFDAAVLKFSPDGTKLAAGGGVERPGLVAIWDLNQP